MDKGGEGLDNFWTAEEFEKAEQRRQQEDEAENRPQGAGPKPNGQAAPAGSEPSSASKDDDDVNQRRSTTRDQRPITAHIMVE